MTIALSRRSAAKQARHRRPTSTDWLWGGLGLSIAGVSASFAAYMIATAPSEVEGTGSKDFNIFVHWDRRTKTLAAKSPASSPDAAPERDADERRRIDSPAVDPDPTGSIRPAAGPDAAIRSDTRGEALPGPLHGYILRDVFGNKALIEHRNKLSLVKRGSILDDAGEVLSIERRGETWIVKTTAGTIGGS